MKKNGKSGLRRLKKTARKNQKELAKRFRLALIAAAGSKKAESKDRRCGGAQPVHEHVRRPSWRDGV